MRQKGKHLTYTDRLIIEKLYNRKASKKEIASFIGCHLDTIYRELRRGMYDHLNSDLTYSRRYSADIAQNDYNQKAAVKGAPLKISNNIKLANYIEKEIIKNHYSPAVVISTIQTKTGRKPFCVSTLYSYIDKGIFLNLTNKHLWEKSKAKTRKKNPVRAKRAPAGTSIEHRPKKYCLETHSVIGKWTLFTANLKAKNKLFLS